MPGASDSRRSERNEVRANYEREYRARIKADKVAERETGPDGGHRDRAAPAGGESPRDLGHSVRGRSGRESLDSLELHHGIGGYLLGDRERVRCRGLAGLEIVHRREGRVVLRFPIR